MFCDRLKELRNQKEMTQAQLAEVLNISKSAIANYEAGFRMPKDDKTWIKIANYFNVSVDYLMDVPDYRILAADTGSVDDVLVLSGDTVDEVQKHRNALANKIRNSDYTEEQLEKIEDMIKVITR